MWRILASNFDLNEMKKSETPQTITPKKQDSTETIVQVTDKENQRPNVILITLDAFGFKLFMENLGILKNIAEWKNQSIFFENAFSTGPTTWFSFPGIVAGVYPYHFGIGIDKNIKTIMDTLKAYGYHTAIINESNAFLCPFFGYGRNVDYQNHFLNLSHAEADRRLGDSFLKSVDDTIMIDPWKRSYQIRKFILNKVHNKWIIMLAKWSRGALRFLKSQLTNKTHRFQERKKLYSEFHSEILDFINERFTSPQFLWIHTIVNHLPYFPLESSEKFNTNEINYLNNRGLSEFVNHKICNKLKILYIESMKRTDLLVGDILQALKKKQLLDNSIIVITADHGEEFMEEGYFEHMPESSSDRILQVPLMIYFPNMPEPKNISVPVSTLDIFPTICDLSGVIIPDTNRGISLKDVLLNQPEHSIEESKFWQRPLFSEAWDLDGLLDRSPGYNSERAIFTVRKGQHKLKVIRQQKQDNEITEKFHLINWISGEKLDLFANRYIVEDFIHCLYDHIYSEGIFVTNLRYKAEKQRINKAISRIKK